MSNLNNLYRQAILEEANHPRHKGKLENKSVEVELRNPTCGDVITLTALIEDNKIKDIAFDGYGCTISQSSASIMTNEVLNKDFDTIKNMVLSFSDMITKEVKPDRKVLGEAIILGGVKQFPARIKCAMLSWKAIYQLIEKYEGKGEKND